jgi:O-antigen ligase
MTWAAAFWLGLATLRDAGVREKFLERVQAAGVMIAVLALVHRTTSQGKVFWFFETGRKAVMGVFPYENQYAAFILLVLPGTLMRAIRGGPGRWGWTAGAAVMVGSVISSSSVAGAVLVLLEALLVGAMFCVELGWPWKKRIALASGILALAAAVGSVSGWNSILSDLERHNALETRRLLTLSTIEMARDRPLAGWGLGTWTEIYPAYARFDDGLFDNAAHNDWAQWAADGGLPMLALMGAFAFLLFVPAVRSMWGIGLLFVLGYSLMEFHFQERPQFACVFFALSGAVMGFRKS